MAFPQEKSKKQTYTSWKLHLWTPREGRCSSVDRSCVPKRSTVLQLLNRLLLGTSKLAKEKARVLFLYVVLFWVCFVFVGECHSSFEWLKRSIENIFFDRRISYFDNVVDNVVSLTDFVLSHVVMLNNVTFSRWEMCCFVLSSSICLLTCSVDTCILNCSFPAMLILYSGYQFVLKPAKDGSIERGRRWTSAEFVDAKTPVPEKITLIFRFWRR